MRIKQKISENWKFSKTNDEFTKVDLPHTWNKEDGNTGGNNYFRSMCTYKKELILSIDNSKKYYIEFEAVNSVSEVIINGVALAKHEGGYSTFRVDFTSVAVEGVNTIEVHVTNEHNSDVYPMDADFTFFGGIYRDVYLITVDSIHIDLDDHGSYGVYVSQTDVSKESAILNVKTNIRNTANISENVKVLLEFLDKSNNIVVSKSLEKEVVTSESLETELVIENPILWHGTVNPYLYNLKVTVSVNDEKVDERNIRTGLRFYNVDKDKGFMLNGEHYQLNGVCRHQCRDGRGWAQDNLHHLEDIEIITEMGANSIRLAHYQHAQYFYDLCDEKGLLIWAEIPYISKSSPTDPTGKNAKDQLVELIKQNYNHSSIFTWGLQNEITIKGGRDTNNMDGIVSDLHTLAKELDPFRLTTQAQEGPSCPIGDPLNDISDIVGYNHYFGWYRGVIADTRDWILKYREQYPDRGVMFSEYGVEGIINYHTTTPRIKDYTEEYHALYHEKIMPIFNEFDYVFGTYVWNMFDFASDLRNEGGRKGMNNKGLVTHDRRIRKDAYYYYKALWSTEKMLHITSKRFDERLEDEIKVKVYTNLENASIYVNGVFIETKTPNNRTIVFESVKLEKGDNLIEVISGEYKDNTKVVLVENLTKDYSFEGCNPIGSAENWF